MKKVQKIPFLDEEGVVRYKLSKEKIKEGIYLPVACFITAFARKVTIETIQKIMDYSIKKYGKNLFIYADTDSCHTLLPLEELKQLCNIDDVTLGCWKCEGKFKRAIFIKQKTYIEDLEGKEKLKITCAGMPEKCYPFVTFENFRVGLEMSGNLKSKTVSGGIILQDVNFKIRSSKKKEDKK